MKGCRVIIWKARLCNIMGKVFGESHILCMLKTSFVEFGKG